MAFYALHIATTKTQRIEPLRLACKKLGIEFKALDPYSFDFSRPSPVKKRDIVYRTNRGKVLRFFEDYIVRPGAVTFYKNELFHKPDPFMLEKHKIPTPPTVFCLSNDHLELLKYVKKLGGFPVILKALGGTRGMGVMKIETESALFSIADFLSAQQKLFVLKKFLPVKTSARFIVLGNKVIASLEYVAKDRDFRTNSSKNLTVRPKKYASSLEDLAVKATEAYGWEFSGVDVLIHEEKPYVSEVNFPCNFMRAQEVCQQDIALQMVQYLYEKSRKL